MNFVHFPKLGDYLLEQELLGDHSKRGQKDDLPAKQASTLPGVAQDRRRSQDKRLAPFKDRSEEWSTSEDLHRNSSVRQVRSNKFVPLPGLVDKAKPTREYPSTNDGGIDTARVSLSPRSYLFRRYDHLLQLPVLDSSRSGERDIRWVREEPMTSSKHAATTKNESSSHTTSSAARVHKLTGQNDESLKDRKNLHETKARKQNDFSLTGVQPHFSTLPASGLNIHSTKKKLSNTRKESLCDMHIINDAAACCRVAQKFKQSAWAIVNILKLAKVIIKRTDSSSALLKTFTSMSRDADTEEPSENMKNYGLEFDLSYFRAKKEISISSEVKTVLRLPPSHRSPEQIQTAMFGLQSLPSFAEYPLHMQEKLTKVAWYEVVTPMRTIIRQGHFAENFYFILAGQALVTIHKPGESSTQTAAILRKGTSFGELALLHHSRRTATVTSHDTVQLLSVGREDFFDIFMSGQGKDEMPEHIKFISHLDFMKDWPLERLLERPDQCLIHFFKRGTLIVKDSKKSDWFYVVKSGSCQVLKQLKGVNESVGHSRKQKRLDQSKYQNENSHEDISVTRKRQPKQKMVPGKVYEAEKRLADQGQGETKTFLPRNQVKPAWRNPSRNEKEGKHAQERRKPAQHTQEQYQPVQRTQEQHEPVQRTQHPVFVQIELLKPKDVFGLDLVNFSNDLDINSPSVSLISLGAECVMLSKALFMKHANDSVKKRFSEVIQPYPTDETLQESLQTKVKWELYKHSLISSVRTK